MAREKRLVQLSDDEAPETLSLDAARAETLRLLESEHRAAARAKSAAKERRKRLDAKFKEAAGEKRAAKPDKQAELLEEALNQIKASKPVSANKKIVRLVKPEPVRIVSRKKKNSKNGANESEPVVVTLDHQRDLAQSEAALIERLSKFKSSQLNRSCTPRISTIADCSRKCTYGPSLKFVSSASEHPPLILAVEKSQ